MANKISVNSGGIGNEPWYKSRRIWAVVMNILAVIAYQYTTPYIGNSIIAIGTGLGLTSWIKPK